MYHLAHFDVDFFSLKGQRRLFFKKVYWLSALFLFVNGCTYFADALIFFNLAPEVTIIIRLITAAVSWIFLVSAIAALSKALSTKTRKELMEEIAKRMQMEYELKIKKRTPFRIRKKCELGLYILGFID